ncbi:MAG: hypothetical protein CME70_02275 [Halobacteriovorax sp.]|nr:hypothetical protein [Halobacteriovorax sp.]|tara:strand:- start:65756 stop:66397 length:642 start_codon:yes stop_codon:yes gene_type:complete
MNESSKFGFDLFSRLPVFEKMLFENPNGPFLEIGCGKLPFLPDYLSLLGPVECIDFSENAIEFCKKHYKEGTYSKTDILDFKVINTYAMVMDAHLLHCLDSLESYKLALLNIKRCLKPGGLFLLETMTSHTQMAFELNLNYEPSNFKLYKGDRVSRLVLPSIVIEELILEAGLRIEFFKVEDGLRMIPHDNREESIPEDPQVLRLIASRPKGH